MYHVLYIISLLFITSCHIKSSANKTFEDADVKGKLVSELSSNIWVVYQDRSGDYWFGSNDEGVFHLKDDSITQYSLKDLASDQIRGIQEDSEGNIYFDTPGGFCQFDGHKLSKLHLSRSNANAQVWNSTDIWFKGNGDINGAFRYDGDSVYHYLLPEFDLYEVYGKNLNDSPYSPYGVYSMYKDDLGYMWFGTLGAGVYHVGNDSFWIAEPELSILEDGRAPGVRSILKDKSGNIWLGNMIYRYEILKNQKGAFSGYNKLSAFDNQDITDNIELPYYLSAIIDENDHLWLATYDEGVYRYDGETLEQVSCGETLEETFVISIYQDREGQIWLGSQNRGVLYYDGHAFVQFTPTEEGN